MASVIPIGLDAHERIEALLPWYHRGGLSSQDQEAVRLHLLGCSACCEALAREEALGRLMGATPPLPVGSADAGWARLQGRLGTAPTPTAARVPSGPRWMPWALGLQTAVLVLVVGLWIAAPTGGGDEAYRGLSSSASHSGNAVLVFKPGTTEQQVRALLQHHQARLVAGPTATGAWLLQVPPEALPALRQAPEVEGLDAVGGAAR